MAKLNCWEFKKCGKELVCPVAKENPKADGINKGTNAGRICWIIAGTMCDGKIQGEFAQKQLSCLACGFFSLVKDEEGRSFHLLLPGQRYEPPKE